MTVQAALNAVVDLVKTIDVANPPSNRVWAHPGESTAINLNSLPAVVVSKMNAEPGSWGSSSFGEGRHQYQILIAAYLAEGPVVVTNADDITVAALEDAHEWYEAMADLLFANMKLSGTVQIIGDGEGQLFEYITDNILWDGKQYYGHLFLVTVTQEVIQEVSA